jgi:DNA mismatch repair ATPase MutS
MYCSKNQKIPRFIRKLVKGVSAHSFGIHRSKNGRMPQIVILKAQSFEEIRKSFQ